MSNVGSIVPRLLRLAWPVALTRLGIMGMGVVDVMVVGQFATKELPYQALGWAPINVLTVTGIGLLTGVQVLAARSLGAGRREEAGAAWRRGLMLSVVASALASALLLVAGERALTVFGIAPELARPALRVTHILLLSMPLQLVYVASSFFLEAIQRPVAATVAMWTANVVNLALNLLLVPRFGAEGSAWCTVAARFSLAAILFVYIARLADAEALGVRRGARIPGYGALLRVGAAAAISHAAEAGAFSGMTILAGRQGSDAVSAYQIVLNVLAVVFMVALGMSSATAVLTSEAVGRKDEPGAGSATFHGLVVSAALMALCGLLVFVFAGPLARAFTADRGLVTMLVGTMWVASLVMLPDGTQVVAASALRARGDNWFPTASHLVAYAAFMPALGYYLGEVRGRGVAGLLLAVFWSSLLSSAVLCCRAWWLHSKSSRREAALEPQRP